MLEKFMRSCILAVFGTDAISFWVHEIDIHPRFLACACFCLVSFVNAICSLMESFVPFGGLFSLPSELKGPLNGLYQSAAQCNEKSQQEVIAVSKERFAAWVSDQYQSSLPPWLQTSEPGTNKDMGAKVCIPRKII